MKNILKFSFLVFTVLAIIASGVLYYLDFSRSLDKDDIKVNVIETNKPINTDSGAINSNNTELNKTQNNTKVKQELIKYFKNKQNTVKIQ